MSFRVLFHRLTAALLPVCIGLKKKIIIEFKVLIRTLFIYFCVGVFYLEGNVKSAVEIALDLYGCINHIINSLWTQKNNKS